MNLMPEDPISGVAVLGDGIEMLRRLDAGSVSCLYVDPPFNTGRVFEHYDDAMDPEQWSAWLAELLDAAKRALRPDGVLWLHLDRFGLASGKALLDAALPVSLGVAAWRRTLTTPRSRGVGSTVDFLLVAGMRDAKLRRLPRSAAVNREYRNPDVDPRGPWRALPLTAPDAVSPDGFLHPSVFGVEHPVSRKLMHPPKGLHWSRPIEKMAELYAAAGLRTVHSPADVTARADAAGVRADQVREHSVDLRLAPDAGEMLAHGPLVARPTTIALRGHLADAPGQTPSAWWDGEEVGTTGDAKRHLKALLPGASPFSTPKPEALLARVIALSSDPGDLVVDPCAGSATTAAVAHKLGRRWVTSELSASTFEEHVLPRLGAVVAGTDPGGVTRSAVRVEKTPLPDGVTPDDAARFVQLLGWFERANDLPESKSLRKAAATSIRREVVWPGGGAFRVERL